MSNFRDVDHLMLMLFIILHQIFFVGVINRFWCFCSPEKNLQNKLKRESIIDSTKFHTFSYHLIFVVLMMKKKKKKIFLMTFQVAWSCGNDHNTHSHKYKTKLSTQLFLLVLAIKRTMTLDLNPQLTRSKGDDED